MIVPQTSNNILLVDDKPDNLKLLAMMLEAQGYRVRRTTSGRLALQAADVAPPDLILLDVNMPEMDGYEVCRRLKQYDKTRDIPVIFISAYNDVDYKVKAFDVGGVDYVTKPFQESEVLARVNSQLTLRDRERQLTEQNQQLQAQEKLLRLQSEREQRFSRILQSVYRSIDLHDILNTAVEEVRNLLQVDRVVVYRFLPDWRGQVVAESLQNQRFSILDIVIEDYCIESGWHHYYKGGGVTLLENIQDLVHVPEGPKKQCYVNQLTGLQVRANCVVPLLSSDSLWGLLIAHTCEEPRHWQEWEVDFLKQFAMPLMIAIQQAEIYAKLQSANDELERLANLDGLTQLFNRRFFDHKLQQEWKRLHREQRPLSMLITDVDAFKNYNDHYGHQAGDECLKQVAETLRQSVNRPADCVARYGGEEFVALLPNTTLSGATRIAERMLQAVERLQIPHVLAPHGGIITASIGVSTIVPDIEISAEQFLAEADKALYAAKKGERNTYRISMLQTAA